MLWDRCAPQGPQGKLPPPQAHGSRMLREAGARLGRRQPGGQPLSGKASEGWGPGGPHAWHVGVFPAFPSVCAWGVVPHTTKYSIHTEKCIALEQV